MSIEVSKTIGRGDFHLILLEISRTPLDMDEELVGEGWMRGALVILSIPMG